MKNLPGIPSECIHSAGTFYEKQTFGISPGILQTNS